VVSHKILGDVFFSGLVGLGILVGVVFLVKSGVVFWLVFL